MTFDGLAPPMSGPMPSEAPYEEPTQPTGPYDAPDSFDPPQPEITYIPAKPPEPSAAFQKRAFEYITDFCRASRSKMEPYIASAEHAWKWYRGELTIDDLVDKKYQGTTSTSNALRSPEGLLQKTPMRQHSDFLYPINILVDAAAFFSYLAIFSGPEFVSLTNADDRGVVANEDIVRQNEAVKRLLLKRLKDGKFRVNIWEILIDWILTGTAITLTFWYTHDVRKWRELVIGGERTGKIEEYPETVYEAPVTQAVKLSQFLPDPKATSKDVNRWRGVGHIIRKTYDEAIQDFNSGYFHLNRSEFEKRFKDAGNPLDDQDRALEIDTTTAGSTDQEEKVTEISFVEWQGRVPDGKRGLIESVAVIAYQTAADTGASFKDGVLVRLREETISESGYRTVNVCPWGMQPGPVGRGLPACNEELLYQLSQFLGQIQDAARHSCNAARGYDKNDHGLEAYIAEGKSTGPGSWVPMEGPDSVWSLPKPDVDISILNVVAQQFLGIIEKGAGVEQPDQQYGAQMKATIGNMLRESSQAPGTARTQGFAEDIITPAVNLSMWFLRTNTFDDESVLIPDFDSGTEQPLKITREDLQNGKWIVEASLTSMDNSQTVVANILKELIIQAPALNQALQADNKAFSTAEALNIMFASLKVPNADRVVRTLGSREQALIQQIQELQQQLEQAQGAQSQQKPPSMSIPYAAVPPEAQVQMLAQAGINIPPEIAAEYQAMQAAQTGQSGMAPDGGGGGMPMQGQQMPPEFGMNGGPMGEVPSDDNMIALQNQLAAAQREGSGY